MRKIYVLCLLFCATVVSAQQKAAPTPELNFARFSSTKDLFEAASIFGYSKGAKSESEILDALKKVPGVSNAYTYTKQEFTVTKQSNVSWAELNPLVIAALARLAPYGATIQRVPDPPPVVPTPINPAILFSTQQAKQPAQAPAPPPPPLLLPGPRPRPGK